MSIKLKNVYFETVVANQAAFNALLNKSFPAKIGYWISRAISKIQSESKIYFTAKNNLLKQYAELDEKGGLKAESDGSVAWKNNGAFVEFSKELENLHSIEIELNMDEIEVDLNELEEKGITLSPIEGILLPFLKPS